ncbi:PREDICTED: probable LRR receptor-like serine/threonine-protein kinase At1g07560 [Camelina sativa]|uniref:non-specific serine/threonine protein kinase n=1 Tax=Camelina sativa TaxID=90675 RepID=A0ABM0WSG6_CAMSA|nr:PREDICTED: probable LRR receptor-like serine/threonine-protein kinase At1g07560 [Camelina sativa]
MKNLRGLLSVFLIIMSFGIPDFAQAQDQQQGFINLDCGLQANESPYTEPMTKLTFRSDADFIKSGKSGKIQNVPGMEYIKPYTVLRYFPDGVRNCYTLSVLQGTNYLIVAMFTYGNYDNLNTQPKFDLYLGPNIWTTVDLQRNINGTREEIIHVPRSTSLQVCLVKTGITTPLISALELRPLRNDTYIPQFGSLKNLFRVYLTDSKDVIRYPVDVHDRLWTPFFMPGWKLLRTSLSINTSDNDYNLPEDVVATAATPANVSSPLTISWNLETPNDLVYAYLHVAEIQSLRDNDTREFNISVGQEVSYGPVSSDELLVYTLFNTSPVKCKGGTCHLQLIRTSKSTLPPLLNAIEAFTTVELPQSETNANDVIAIKSIETSYQLSKISWQGDPCVPQQFLWDGLTCEYTNMSTPPRIHSLDLSSSELTGIIVPAIQNLTELQRLDVSNNNLTGGVPEFLAEMKSLLVINLSGNDLSGSVPQALLDKVKKGLKLNIEGNPNLCSSGSCNKKKDSIMLPVVASLASLAAIIAMIALLFVCLKRHPSRGKGLSSSQQQSIVTKKRRYTYAEVLAMTNNFVRVLGKGGFGMVYHGYINGTEEVAVKLLSPSSAQGYKEFKTEVELLLRVYHTNLVSLVGYCDEKDHLALIYQYMANGDLKQHLSGSSIISWVDRLNIAVDAALGLEYLHIGCKPLIVHRDVKSSNILLDDQLQAKLADFGLSRSFPVGDESHVSTRVAGTFGYLDHEYYQTNRLSEKSDVYAFGVVLLEIITNKPVIDQTRDMPHIAEWAKFMLTRGDISNIVDPKLQGVYDSGSAWKALELAMTCVKSSSLERPNMSHVVHELKECVISENKRTRDIDTVRSIDTNLSFSTDMNPKAR